MYHSWLLLLMGAFPLLIATYLLQKEVTLRRDGIRTTGVIVDVRQERSLDGDGGSTVLYHPIVRFTTYNGQEIIWEGINRSTGWKNTRGKQIQIIYDAQNPQRAIRNHWSGYAWIVLLCLISAASIVFFFIGKF